MPERKYEWWSGGHSYAAIIEQGDLPHRRVFIFTGPDPEHRAQAGVLTFRSEELEGFLDLFVWESRARAAENILAWLHQNMPRALELSPYKLTRYGVLVEGDESPTAEQVDHPDHYGGAENPYEAIKVIEAVGWGEGFVKGNALKYLMRAGRKPGTPGRVDLEKAKWYIERAIEQDNG